MRITHVKSWLVEGIKCSWVLTKVDTDAGISGIGEGTNWPGSPMVIESPGWLAVSHAPSLLGLLWLAFSLAGVLVCNWTLTFISLPRPMAILASMLEEQRGANFNIRSVHAQATVEGFASYAASKAGILGLTRALAIECGPRAVRVSAISPGTPDSPLLEDYFNSCPDPVRARDIGNMVTFLASDEAGFVPGTEIVVDGGMTALLFKQ